MPKTLYKVKVNSKGKTYNVGIRADSPEQAKRIVKRAYASGGDKVSKGVLKDA